MLGFPTTQKRTALENCEQVVLTPNNETCRGPSSVGHQLVVRPLSQAFTRPTPDGGRLLSDLYKRLVGPSISVLVLDEIDVGLINRLIVDSIPEQPFCPAGSDKHVHSKTLQLQDL